jgi:integrase
MKVELKGIAKVRSKGRDYWYAWRGGPRLRGEPGSPEFMQSYNEAIEGRRAPDDGRFRSLIILYKASTAYAALAVTTKANWNPWLDRIRDYFGELRIDQFDRRDKIRPIIKKWRNRYADRPRTADFGIQVLSKVLSQAVDEDRLTVNACEGIAHLYSGDRSEIIWTDADIIRLKKVCSGDIGNAVDLAALTGLRLGDLVRLSWSHIGDDEITIKTGKGRRRNTEAVIPLYDGLRELLARIPKRSTTVLTNSRKRPWTVSGLKGTFFAIKKKADFDLHFHDLRGTAATKFYVAGLPERAIAEIMGWQEEQVTRIIRRYVGRSAATRAIIEQMSKARSER